MAGSSFFALLDDIATILDDVSVLSKVAIKKTSGVLGDDLALNAEQVSGVSADRELPVVWAVAKGSGINKVILVPLALVISYFAPWAITPLLMIGGLYLCFEGAENLIHGKGSDPKEDKAQHAKLIQAIVDPQTDLVALEKQKIKGAIRTDFVLSAEIIVISLGTVSTEPFLKQVSTLTIVAILMTIGVYGLVAVIVKLDDIGLHLIKGHASGIRYSLGKGLLLFAPKLMKSLAVIGMVAMFMVGGGILAHGIPIVRHGVEVAAKAVTASLGGVSWAGSIAEALLNAICGVLSGFIAAGIFIAVQKLKVRKTLKS